MPRGGGTKGVDAGRGLLADEQYGSQFSQQLLGGSGILPNAEALILEHQRNRDPALERAGISNIDAEATAELLKDKAKLAEAVGIDDPKMIVDASVRGNAAVVVYDDGDGNLVKVVGPANDDYVPPRLTQEQALRLAEAQAAEEQAAQYAEELAKTRSELEAKFAEELEDLRQQTDERMREMLAESAAPGGQQPGSIAADRMGGIPSGGGGGGGGTASSRSASERAGERSERAAQKAAEEK